VLGAEREKTIPRAKDLEMELEMGLAMERVLAGSRC